MFLFDKKSWPAWDDKQPDKDRLCIGVTKRSGSLFYFVIMDGWDGVIVKISGNGTLAASNRPPLCWQYADELGVRLRADIPKRGVA